MATVSHKIILIRFLERIRGALMDAPTSDEPVKKIPHAAPATENPIQIAMAVAAYAYGSILSNRIFQLTYGVVLLYQNQYCGSIIDALFIRDIAVMKEEERRRGERGRFN